MKVKLASFISMKMARSQAGVMVDCLPTCRIKKVYSSLLSKSFDLFGLSITALGI